MTDVAHEIGNREDQVRSTCLLPSFSIYLEPQMERVGILDLVPGHEVRAERRECVRALSLDPLSAAFQLEFTFAVIVV